MQQLPRRGVKARRRSIRSAGTIGARGGRGSDGAAGSMLPALALPAAGPLASTKIPAEEVSSPVSVPAGEDSSVHEPGWWDRRNLQRLSAEYLTRVWNWLTSLTLEHWLWIGVIVLATLLRFWGLGDKPLHHDESMHAYFSLAFAQNPSSYRYDPLLHGPFQFHAEGLMLAVILGLQAIFVHGVTGNPWINDTTARIVPALFGIGIVILPLGLRRELGRYAALIAAFLLAVSPTFVYFSRFLREDIYFNFFMFAMVVSAVRFAHRRELRWFMALAASTVLAYATFEGIYLTVAIFGAFLALLLVWELAYVLAQYLPRALTRGERLFFSRAILLTALGMVGGLLAIIGLKVLGNLSTYINAHQTQSDVKVANLENISVAALLYGSILIALLVIGTLLWRMYCDEVRASMNDARLAQMATLSPTGYGEPAEDGESGLEVEEPRYSLDRLERIDHVLTAPSRWGRHLRDRFDPDRQHFLRTLFSINWIYWFMAFVVAWVVFAALYWTIPGPGGYVSTWAEGFQQGIGRGIWQGLYYWIEQQNVDRGGQPLYYYLLLIPLYEQLAVVFGLVGVVYSLIRPTRFRIFLVWWFTISLFLYSWAGEKMPWLSIHILLPLMLLAAIMVARSVEGCVALARHWWQSRLDGGFLTGWSRREIWRPAASILGTAFAVLLLIPMVYGMVILSHQDAADGPHEMMIYVQTTEDVDTVMNYINHADQVLYHGQHKLRIAVGAGEEWPYYWYLRDYPNTYL